MGDAAGLDIGESLTAFEPRQLCPDVPPVIRGILSNQSDERRFRQLGSVVALPIPEMVADPGLTQRLLTRLTAIAFALILVTSGCGRSSAQMAGNDAASLVPSAALDVNLTDTTDGSTDSVAVSGIGSRAEYVDHSGSSQYLGARVGSYLVSVTACSVVPDVPEASLEPLIVKSMGQIPP